MNLPTAHTTTRPATGTAYPPARQAFLLLRTVFTIAPIAFGLDKFLELLTDWEQYLAPWVNDLVPGSAHDAMLMVGVVEIAAGVLVAVSPASAGTSWRSGWPASSSTWSRSATTTTSRCVTSACSSERWPWPGSRRLRPPRPSRPDDPARGRGGGRPLAPPAQPRRAGGRRCAAERAAGDLLRALGVDTTAEGTAETPRRMADAYAEMLAVPAFDFTTFPNTEGYDELVLVQDIPVRSVCEHHMLPFVGVAHVGYLPADRILGLSKVARLVDFFARRAPAPSPRRCRGPCARTPRPGPSSWT